jgi:dipeptidyl aminopeptidase/acylaminoacyl peptidase
MLLTVAAGVLLAALAVFAIAFRNYAAARLDFEPWPASAALRHPERTGVPNIEAVAFRSQDGLRIAAWYVPSRNRAAVVLAHGTNADRSSMLPEMRLLAGAGYGVLAFDWPGDGESEGEIHWGPLERHALTAAVTWLAARPDVDPRRIGGLGFSMGGFFMTQLGAVDPRLHAVVIEAAPPDYEEYLHPLHDHWGMLSQWPALLAVRRSGMVLGEMSPRSVIGSIAPRPVLVIGGALDGIIPPSMADELYAAAREPKSEWIVPNARHGNYAEVAGPEYGRRLLAFFGSTLAADSRPGG